MLAELVRIDKMVIHPGDEKGLVENENVSSVRIRAIICHRDIRDGDSIECRKIAVKTGDGNIS